MNPSIFSFYLILSYCFLFLTHSNIFYQLQTYIMCCANKKKKPFVPLDKHNRNSGEQKQQQQKQKQPQLLNPPAITSSRLQQQRNPPNYLKFPNTPVNMSKQPGTITASNLRNTTTISALKQSRFDTKLPKCKVEIEKIEDEASTTLFKDCYAERIDIKKITLQHNYYVRQIDYYQLSRNHKQQLQKVEGTTNYKHARYKTHKSVEEIYTPKVKKFSYQNNIVNMAYEPKFSAFKGKNVVKEKDVDVKEKKKQKDKEKDKEKQKQKSKIQDKYQQRSGMERKSKYNQGEKQAGVSKLNSEYNEKNTIVVSGLRRTLSSKQMKKQY